jgi:hypothetical protein
VYDSYGQAWMEKARSWIGAVLGERGLRWSGEVEPPRQLPWTTVVRVPSREGTVYFKASHRLFWHEPALTQALYEWRPDCMVEVLGVNLEEGWMLMADEGLMLRSHIHSADDLHHWHVLLPRFAQVQIELAGMEQDLLKLGVFDRRLEGLPAQFEELLEDERVLGVGSDGGLNMEQYNRLQSLIPALAEMCSRLSDYPIPESLHHDDFHDGNVFVRGERYTFSDWGESCFTHPFFSMVINLRSTGDRLGLPEEATESPERFTPELNRLRDAYLEPWTAFAPLETLKEVFSLAWRVGMVNRALTWRYLLVNSDEAVRKTYGHTVPAWLGEFLLAVDNISPGRNG